ncbi:LysE family transporter [Staphylococcus sp. Marseille-Q5304]|uniref:LysE/ArgO family amino acid transporter n=1 Tax=Staphylococcus sp. Marseille-Q5304 TaxID=2942200 RepID=UPI0020738A74|nr:LysE family transporter [Staphylococcus sp. Marseille-Q5304]
MQSIIHGFLLSLGLILPLGAQNVFIFNQAANHKSLFKTLPVIIAAGLCDTFLITLAILGVSLIIISMPILQIMIYIIGLIFLIYMAWSLWHEKPSTFNTYNSMSAKKQVSFALSVSLLNPHAIMDTIGVIGTNANIYDGWDKIFFSLTTISVSWIWFLFLAIVGKKIGHIDKSGKYIVLINKCSSIIILIISILIFKSLFELIF